jgi:hypothetical protein
LEEVSGSEIAEVDTKNQKVAEKQVKTKKRKWFGYFTFGEIFVMFIGTLVVAGLVYLILEFS